MNIKYPKVSIIIPMYNAEKRIERCLNSIKNQDYKNLEVIIINDGSTDESLNKCKKCIENDRRFSVITQKNMGVSDARNQGLKKASGEYIMFVDSDDTLELNAITTIMDKNHGGDIIAFGYTNYKEETNKVIYYEENEQYLSQEEALKCFMYNKIFFGALWNKIFKASALKNIYFDTKIQIGEDLLFQYYVLKKIDSVQVINKRLYNYFTYSENTCNSSSLEKWLQFEYITKFILEDNKNSNFEKYSIIKYVESNYFILRKAYNNTNKIYKYCKKNIIQYFWAYIFSPAYIKNKIKIILLVLFNKWK